MIGGPAVNDKLISVADKCLANEVELLEYIKGKEVDCNKLKLDYTLEFPTGYFVPSQVIPLKSTNTCFWKKCAFCTHYSSAPLYLHSLEQIKRTVLKSKANK